ncbi:MAG: hypothetical protein J7M20_03410, partial [Deltaproteobacteria bacterium]|nr:hypothetical protein [Deltaproteobacteria bacterium]
MTRYKKPKRFFEDAGIVDPGSAYHVEMENVSNTKGQDIKSMVDLGRYFSIFAPRQSGKTTFFEGVCKHLANDPAYIPILLSFQYMKNLDAGSFYGRIREYLFDQLIERLEAVQCAQ